MKTANSPRWSCRIVRWCSALSDERRLGAGHIAGCPSCQSYFSAEMGLTTALRQQAAQRYADAPAGLDRRIIAAIGDSRPKAVARRRLMPPVFAVAGAAAAVAIGFAVWQGRQTSLQPGREISQPKATVPSIADLTKIDPSVITGMTAPVSQLLNQDPLQSEVDSVYADAQSAVRFLALNFLPDGNTTSLTPSRRSQPRIRGT